jgi:hypothetical protein
MNPYDRIMLEQGSKYLNKGTSSGVIIVRIFIAALALLLIALKLVGVVEFSWVWVTCPIWGALGISCLGVFVGSLLGRR